MVFKVNTNKKRFYRQYVGILNSALDLSNRELDVLAIILELDINWDRESYKDIIDAGSRKEIMAKTLVNKHNLSRYIKKYKDKKVILLIDGGWVFNPNLIPVVTEDEKTKIEYCNVLFNMIFNE